jgi:hypothetical protein
MLLSRYLSNREKQWGIIVVPGQRVQVKPTRFRVPDILAFCRLALRRSRIVANKYKAIHSVLAIKSG